MPQNEERFVNIEVVLAEHEKMLDDLNQVIIEQGRTIDKLLKQNQYLLSRVGEEAVKPQSEETPPPHC